MSSQHEERRVFFEDLREIYARENRDFHWEWEQVNSSPELERVLSYLAYNLSKSVLHGPLPDHLHNRMVLASGNEWSRAYFEYLGS